MRCARWLAVAAVLAVAGCAAPAPPPTSSSGTTGTAPSATTGGTTSAPTTSTTGTPGPTSTPAPRTSRPAPSATTSAPSPAPQGLAVGRPAWVAVSVATVWRSPTSPRAVDQPALRSPADVRGWLAGLTTSGRRGLVGRADTQVLLGDRVVVTALRSGWAKVVVPDQPTPLDGRGYPGWVPTRQLAALAPTASGQVATVVARTTWLRTDTAAASRVVEVSFGTRLPLVGSTGSWVRVGLPGGAVRRVAASAVVRHVRTAPALAATGAGLVRSAQSFTGLPYLWAGRSGFGFDCSGLTSLVYRVHGTTIPRDADAQALAGRAVGTSSRVPGDLLFYATDSGYVHHVAMYAGQGLMVQSPATGRTVETIAVSTPSYAAEYAGARRLLR